MYENLLLLFVGFLFGLLVTIVVRLIYDSIVSKRYLDGIYNPHGWCIDGCKYMDECYANHKDADEAERNLEKFCSRCPIEYACNVIDKDTVEKAKHEFINYQ